MVILIVIIIILLLIIVWLAVTALSRGVVINRINDAGRSAKNQYDEVKQLRLKLEFAIKSLAASIWEYDVINDRLSSQSPKSSLIKGLTFDEYVAIHYPQEAEIIRNEFARLRNGEITELRLNLRLRVEDGEYRWILVHGRVYEYTADGKIAKIVGLRQDVHEDILNREEFSANKKLLEEYAIQTDLALRSADIVVWEYDMINKVFSSPNKQSYIHDGWEADRFIESVSPEDQAIVVAAMKEFYVDRTWFNCKIRVNIPNQGLRCVELSATILSRDDNGRPIKLTGIKRDVTHEHEMTSELIELRDKAEKSNQLKSAFLANMSHEIRTPLNAIVGFSNMMALADDDEQKKEYQKIIEINNDLLLQLISDILDLSKIEAGKMEFHMNEINVNELMNQFEQMFSLRAQNGVKVTFESHSDDDPYITCDQNRLSQVITNFLSNAVKFTFVGEIRIGYEACENETYFYVSDTGKGMAAENLPYVFDRFAKFDPEIHGTGLGLSICKTIVGRLGGEIGVESELGKGTKFWFTVASKLHYCVDVSAEEDVADSFGAAE